LNGTGQKFFIDEANKDVSKFTGHVGKKKTGPLVTVTTLGKVDTGAGFATIKPAKGQLLQKLTFTPGNPNLFSDFSFRGQLLKAGFVTIIVQDNQGHAAKKFFFKVGQADEDFGRVGVDVVGGVRPSKRSPSRVPASRWLSRSNLARCRNRP